MTSDTSGGKEIRPTPIRANAASSTPIAPEGCAREEVRQPAKVVRIGAMVMQLLDEVRKVPALDEASRLRLRRIHDESIRELGTTLSPDLAHELDQMTLPDNGPTPSVTELRVAQAQLVGWLDGLCRGMEASVLAEQFQSQLHQQAKTGETRRLSRTGTYL